MPKPVTIYVLFFQQGDYWVGQGLNYDITAQGASQEECRVAFRRTMRSQWLLDQERGRKVFDGLRDAPDELWKIYMALTRQQRPVTECVGPAEGDDLSMVPPAFMLQLTQDNHYN